MKIISALTDSAIYWPGIIFIKDTSSANIISIFKIIGSVDTQVLPQWSIRMKLNLQARNINYYLRLKGIELKPAIVNNPGNNSNVESIYLIIGYIIRIDNLTGLHWQEEITALLQSVQWDLISTVHTTNGYYLGQKALNMI